MRWLNTRLVCERYDITIRTVSRWIQDGTLPPPIIIHRRMYWSNEALDARDAARAVPPPPTRRRRSVVPDRELALRVMREAVR